MWLLRWPLTDSHQRRKRSTCQQLTRKTGKKGLSSLLLPCVVTLTTNLSMILTWSNGKYMYTRVTVKTMRKKSSRSESTLVTKLTTRIYMNRNISTSLVLIEWRRMNNCCVWISGMWRGPWSIRTYMGVTRIRPIERLKWFSNLACLKSWLLSKLKRITKRSAWYEIAREKGTSRNLRRSKNIWGRQNLSSFTT